jgi:hypothetical protein
MEWADGEEQGVYGTRAGASGPGNRRSTKNGDAAADADGVGSGGEGEGRRTNFRGTETERTMGRPRWDIGNADEFEQIEQSTGTWDRGRGMGEEPARRRGESNKQDTQSTHSRT